jgi:hypothetical protein
VRQDAKANNGILAGDNTVFDKPEAENNLQLKREPEQRKLHRIAKVHDVLEMWQGTQNLHATRKESHTENKQKTAVGYISDTQGIVIASWTNIQLDGAAALKLSERSPQPPALPAKEHLGERTQILNERRIKKMVQHPVESKEDSHPKAFLIPEIGLAGVVTWIT